MLAYNDCDGEVKMDANMISAMLKMLTDGNFEQTNAQDEAKMSQNSASVFAVQNGLGEHVNIKSQQKQDVLSYMLKNMPTQNPLLGLLGAMQGGGKDLSGLLPLITSLMQKTQNKSEKSNQDDLKKHEEIEPQSNKKDINTIQNKQTVDCVADKETKEMHTDTFSPIAFAGYNVASAICAMLKIKR